MSDRRVERIVTAHQQVEGGGFLVRRPFPTGALALVDPFLLLDEMGPADYGPGEALGAPDHPHRGFETVTYMLAGAFEHEDSAGHKGAIAAGDVQWMTAGRGVVHSEMPVLQIRERGGRVHGFHWTLAPGARVEQPLAEGHNAFVYVFEGRARVGADGRELRQGQAGLLGRGASVLLSVPASDAESSRLLLLSGQPLGEPVARYGPFVMNTEAEIAQAIADYRAGRLGEIQRGQPSLK